VALEHKKRNLQTTATKALYIALELAEMANLVKQRNAVFPMGQLPPPPSQIPEFVLAAVGAGPGAGSSQYDDLIRVFNTQVEDCTKAISELQGIQHTSAIAHLINARASFLSSIDAINEARTTNAMPMVERGRVTFKVDL
jgi:hypothetical protein